MKCILKISSINLKNKSCCGYDNISYKHIKYAKNVLTNFCIPEFILLN